MRPSRSTITTIESVAVIAAIAAILATAFAGSAAADDWDPVEIALATLMEADYSGDEDIPLGVRLLNGDTVLIRGYMHAETRDGSKTFLLTSAQCACGGRPALNHFVEVTLTKTTKVIPGEIEVVGKFSVGEVYSEEGFVTSVYRISGARIE